MEFVQILVRFFSKIVGFWSDFGQIFWYNRSDSQSDFGKFESDSNNIYTEIANLRDFDLRLSGIISGVNIDDPAKCVKFMPKSGIS